MEKRSNFKIMARLIGLVKPLAGFMILAVMLGLCGHLAATFITVSGGFAVLNLLGFETAFTIKGIFIFMVIMGIARGFLRYGEQECNHYIAFKLLALIRDQVFRALRRLCPAKLEVKDKGNLISLITSDIELLEVFYAHTISPICIATIYSIIMTVFIWKYNFILGLIALAAYITVGIIIPVCVSKAGGKEGLEYRDKTGAMSSFVLDSLRGLTEIIQYGTGRKRLENMDEKSDDLAKYEYSMKMRAGRNFEITGAVVTGFDVLMLLVSAHLYTMGSIGFDGIIIPVIAMMSSFGPCIALANLGSTLENTFAAGNRVLDILDEEPVTSEITGKEPTIYSGANLENVNFAYEDEEILRDVSMNFERGEIVGIQGKSGSGKSTILKLIMRFWETDSGMVSISKRNVDDINTADLRAMESYVTQETHLFRDSIYNNMRIAKPDATEDEIKEACRKASVHDFIMSLPDGYDTEVGELGDTLSGGEKQRMGLARAFLHDGDLLLLDEPTSNLDSLNEAIVLNSLDKTRGEKTVILVSHRKSTMRIADRVYEMKEDRIS